MAPPVVLEMAVQLGAAPEVVWGRLVDWEHLDQWMHEASDFQVTSPNREGVGVRAEATIRIAGITTRDAITVTRWEPPEWLEIRHEGWVKGHGLMHCRPAPDGTYLWWRESLLPPLGWAGWLGLKVMQPVMRRVFQRDLGLLKALLGG